jgi:hypothetical protein
MGAGPSLKDYVPLDNCITVGTNGVVLYSGVRLDYLFCQDFFVFKNNEKLEQTIMDYPCKKFFRFFAGYPWNLPIHYRDRPDVEEYCAYNIGYIDGAGYLLDEAFSGHMIPLNICNAPMSDFLSVIFPAVQFALWTYPERIYLVGCDCNLGLYHFNNTLPSPDKITLNFLNDHLLPGWQKIKTFAQTSYPDVEIISINPVGLKGLFKDIYTDSYLEKHPDIIVNADR